MICTSGGTDVVTNVKEDRGKAMDLMKEKLEKIENIESLDQIDKINENKPNARIYKDDELLYHYTDFIALNGILKERELRVNNVLNMNDSKEMELFVTGITKAVEKRFASENNDKMVANLESTLNAILNNFYDYSMYAACFSEYRNDAAQWERYANRGKGICLCFRKTELEKMAGGVIRINKVSYQDNMESHPLVEELYQYLQKHEKPEYSSTLMEAIKEAWWSSASFKHPSFSSEHEVRLVLMPFADSDFDLKPGYHVSGERIKKYYPLNLDQMCQNAGITLEDLIVELIVGPESTQSEPILKDYLYDIGLTRLAEQIYRSDCPLRSKL